ncbi:FecR domain-containing protein [Pedobacter sp. ASV1-7]|uniref:FecR family protein n=1 Tax=Pedobacter sp. ASV1-7 TaxID=3145237 RepID=UPI0032E8ED9F
MINRFKHLYKQYIDNTCTEDERDEFLSMVAENPDSDIMESLLDNTWDNLNTKDLSFPQADHVLDNILSQHPKAVAKRISIYQYVAAIAAMVAIITTGVYFYQKDKTEHIAQSDIANIPAGTNKATLTLADGTVINLDNATNGELAQQTGIKITKTADGQLIYDIVDDKKNTASTETAYNTITTPRGGQYQVNLPDGSKIWLNAASSLKYPIPFGKDHRKVELTGEAYFEVTSLLKDEQNTKMPFIVKTDKQQVEVLGTHFNINSYTDENLTRSTLLEGVVRVTGLSAEHASSILKPGQQSVLNDNTLKVQTVDIEEVVAWKNGYFQFNESDLGSIMRQISRWYNIDVVFEGRSPNDLFHFKAPKDQNLTELLKIFEINGINLKIEGRTLIVKS